LARARVGLRLGASPFFNGLLGALGGAESRANDINEQGQVVGWADTATASARGFVRQNGVITDLNDPLPAGTVWQIGEAFAINDNGQILAVASRFAGGQGGTTAPEQHYVLLTLAP